MTSRRLKQKEIAEVRKQLCKSQGNLCPISRKRILPSTSVLDHCHVHGHIRAALSRGMNGAEGKINNLLTRWGGCKTTKQKAALLRRLADYWELHSTPQTDMIHPSFGKVVKRKRKK